MSAHRSKRHSQIGLDRLVRLEWLEKVSLLVLAGNETTEVKRVLQEDLRNAFRSPDTHVRGSLNKTITILTRVWAKAPKELHALQQGGLDLLSSLQLSDHFVVHWGMLSAVYPFWAAVATQIGRLLRLQGTASISEVQRRMREQHGERETVSRRVRYTLRSFVDWRVLAETSEKGVYAQGNPRSVQEPKLISQRRLVFAPGRSFRRVSIPARKPRRETRARKRFPSVPWRTPC